MAARGCRIWVNVTRRELKIGLKSDLKDPQSSPGRQKWSMCVLGHMVRCSGDSEIRIILVVIAVVTRDKLFLLGGVAAVENKEFTHRH